MPFTLIEQWPVKRPPFLHYLVPGKPRHGHMVAIAISALSHLAILYALIHGAFYQEDFTDKPEEETINIIELEKVSQDKKEQEQESASAGQEQAETPPPEEIQPPQTPTHTPITAPEWSMHSITIPAASQGDGQGGHMGVTGNGTGGVYDPFAGASAKIEKINAHDIDMTGLPPQINRDEWLKWVQFLRNRLPRAQGALQISITTNSNGIVTQVDITQSATSTQVILFVRHSLMGRKIANSAMVATPLPDINLPI